MPNLTAPPNKIAVSAADSRAERPLRLLIAAAVIVPMVIFAIAAWISYKQHIADATDRLTRTVMSGSNPQARHWVGKAGAAAMPPNDVAVDEAEARVLVNWLLVLVP